MFSFFKKPTEKEKLQKQYIKLMEQSNKLSTSNRKESDKKYVEAEAIAKKIMTL